MSFRESLTKIDGVITSHEVIRCDPFEPTGDGDMKLVIMNTVGNEYQVDAYRWDKKKSSWVPDRRAIDSPWIIEGNKIISEDESIPFTLTSETLTIEGSRDHEEDYWNGYYSIDKVRVYEYEKVVFRKMSELFE